MEEQRVGASAVYKFLNAGASKPLTLPDFTAWWKTLSQEEKAEYSSGAQALTHQS